MAIPGPGLESTVPGTSYPLVNPGTVTTDSTLSGTGAASSPLSVAFFAGTFLAAALPSAATHKGSLAWVTDSNVVTWGSTVTGSGTSFVLVWSNGTNWTVVGI